MGALMAHWFKLLLQGSVDRAQLRKTSFLIFNSFFLLRYFAQMFTYQYKVFNNKLQYMSNL